MDDNVYLMRDTLLETFPLLELPIELRLAIYDVALTTTVLIQPPVTDDHGDGGYGPIPIPHVELTLPRPNFPINFLLTCQQIYGEARPILYGGNSFQFQFQATSSWTHNTRRFFKQIGPSNCALIRFAEIFFNFPHFFSPDFPCKFPRRSIRSLTGLAQATIIVGTSEAFTEDRLRKGDKDYIKRTVQMLRHHLPESCVLKWDVTGGHPQLQKVLEEVYGVCGYERAETETKRKMVLWMKKRREMYPSTYPPEYCKGFL